MKIDDDFDFGFTSISENNLKEKEIAKKTTEHQNKAQKIFDMILPLLLNLKKDADKNEYIFWPNRAAKIDEFISKLDKIIKS